MMLLETDIVSAPPVPHVMWRVTGQLGEERLSAPGLVRRQRERGGQPREAWGSAVRDPEALLLHG